MTQKSKARGWYFILALAAALVIFVVLGTIDISQRYDLIGL